MRSRSFAAALLACAVAPGALAAGCHRTTDAERRAAERATEAAEDIAQAASLTSSTLDAGVTEGMAQGPDATRERGPTLLAFQLERSDYRRRLERALDRLDRHIVQARGAPVARGARSRALHARRERLVIDLRALTRATESDWATLRTTLERDLAPEEPP